MIELRDTKTRIALRAASAGSSSPGTLIGYASRFNVKSHPLGEGKGGSFREKVHPYAFARCLKDPKSDVKALVNHSPDKILGRQKNKTLDLVTDDKGLLIRVALPATQLGSDVAELVRRGDMDSMSFAFTPDEDSWDEDNGCTCGDEDCDGDGCARGGKRMKVPVRTLKAVTLRDISVLSADPAYPKTSIGLAGHEQSMASVWARQIPESMPMEMRSRIEARMSSADRRKALTQMILSL